MTNATAGPRVKSRRLFWSPWTMVVVALVIRMVVMGFTYRDRLDPARDHWTFGWEMARVARSIVTGQGFSSPYPEPSGPTALVPPLYTYLVAGVFKLFGVYTAASALVILNLNNLFSSFTCLPVFLIARRVFGLRVAAWAGWIWALFPYSITLSNVCVWETLLTTLLLSLAGTCNTASRTLVKLFRLDWLWIVVGIRGPLQPSGPFHIAVSRDMDLAPALAPRK